MKRFVAILSLILLCLTSQAFAATATFEDLGLAPGTYWNGSDSSGGFTSGNAYFSNGYNAAWGSWDGWAYSSTTDTTTAGWSNQFSAVTGSGVNGSASYGVAYDAGAWGLASPPTISFTAAAGVTVEGLWITNTTYAYLSMLNGDGFVTAFGDDDWQMLTITGYTSGGEENTVDVPLAQSGVILDEWLWVDLTSLGDDVLGLQFSFSGSQAGSVPTYVAVDNLSAVPVPGAIFLLGSGLLGLAGLRRRS